MNSCMHVFKCINHENNWPVKKNKKKMAKKMKTYQQQKQKLNANNIIVLILFDSHIPTDGRMD